MTSAEAAPPARRSLPRIVRSIVLAVLAILLLPYVLTPLYRVVDPGSTLILWRKLRGAPVEQTWVPLERIAPVLARTVIASEDARFCTHSGIDWTEIQAAIDDADDLSEVRGGSTITQQVVKNLFLWPGRSFVRKALEAPLALWMDLVLPKRRILEIYLNVAEWGPRGQFGAEAGAQRAFGKPAAKLSAGEAALMAAVLPNPVRRNARTPGPAVRRIAARLQSRAAGSGPVDACIRAG